jgi:tRNA nucleotidyltransferase (CCA-adding enzyme)
MNSQSGINLENISQDLWNEVLTVCGLVAAAGGQAWLVGGSVRDAVLGLPGRDLDLEVFGLDDAALRSSLETNYRLDYVGQSYGIYKIQGLPLDVGLPRRESKTGRGHKSFAVTADPNLSLAEAAARRDFTINAIYFNPLTEEVQDPHGGMADLQKRILRHTSPAFREDPLRVLRGMQFAARFDLTVAPETINESRTIGMEGLAPERVFWEWEKLILRSIKPSRGLKFLDDSGWIRFFPELEALKGCRQDPKWHPEGDVWVHILHCMDSFADDRLDDPREDLVVGLAVLCHDLGKPGTTVVTPEKIQAHGHEEAGAPLTRSFLGRMTNQNDLIDDVVILVVEHMRPSIFYRDQSSDSAIRRLAARVGRIDRLVRVARADVLGRPPLPDDPFPAGPWLLAQALRLEVCVQAVPGLVQGRHLIELGFSPGFRFKEILDRCYEAQLDGQISTLEDGKALVLREFDETGEPEN